MPDPLNTEQRRYAMTRIAAGDYLLPSNDGQTLWRITSYEEDGSAGNFDATGKWHGFYGTFWQTAKYERSFQNEEWLTDDDFLDWDRWRSWETGLRTRAEAVKAALA